ncbi:MAG: metal-dependent hydrolase [bacterium]|jgi:hypothetical protein
MAGYKVHISGSLLFCGILYFFPFWCSLPPLGKVICVLLAVFFGLLPDVDTKSKGQALFLYLVLIINGVLIYREEYKRAAYLGFLVILPLLSRHRGWTHSTCAMLLVPGALYVAAIQYTHHSAYDLLPYFLAALLGYASHLVIDRVL